MRVEFAIAGLKCDTTTYTITSGRRGRTRIYRSPGEGYLHGGNTIMIVGQGSSGESTLNIK